MHVSPGRGPSSPARVERRTAVLVLRLRYLIEAESQQFAEEVVAAAFRGDGDDLRWLSPLQDEAFRLLRDAEPAGNMPQAERREHVEWALRALNGDWADEIVGERVAVLEAAHERLRGALSGPRATVIPHPSPDVVGCYVLVPAGAAA